MLSLIRHSAVASCFLVLATLAAQSELRFTLTSDPKSFNPLLADDDDETTVLYLTAGQLIRTNRLNQMPEADLADSWKISPDRKSIVFHLRPNVNFSDGTPFTSADVAYTIRTVTDPKLNSPHGDAFPVGTKTQIQSPSSVTVIFPTPQTGVEANFDQLPIVSAKSEKAVLGPFMVSQYTPGVEILLKRNPHYWKKDASGRQLPYLDTVRLYIQQNNELRYARFKRKEIQLINKLQPALFTRLAKESPSEAINSGPSFDVEFLWFNQVPTAPIPDYKRAWFQSRNFRLAISETINRADLCRVVYLGYATPAQGPASPANKFWFNQSLPPQPFDPSAALKLLQSEGFRMQNNELHDKAGHVVEFSLITSANNKNREGMAVLIQQDLKKLGIKLNIVTLEIRSLIERIGKPSNYEAALLGMVNVDVDPNGQMNIWPSSSPQHAWNPNQSKPATAWEAEIDQLMQTQASAPDLTKRKAAFDRVQQIVRDQVPYVYLVNRNTLSAVSNTLQGVQPARLFPETFWNIDRLSLK